MFVCLLPLTTLSQVITGKVQDTSGNAISNATLALLKAKDSSLVKYSVSNDGGIFTFNNLTNGEYFITASLVGYKKKYSQIITLQDQPTISLTLLMITASKQLSEVTVESRKSVIEVMPDKTIFNVEKSINAAGSTALELLQKSPNVMVDKDDNISMNGKNGIRVYIDGRPSPLSAQDVSAMLRTMQSADIEAIEIITNPSARYEAAGNAGIINIRLKKNKSFGTNGSINAAYNVGVYPKYNTGLNLNHRNSKINVFGTYGYNRSRSESYLYLYRFQNDSIFDQKSTTDFHNKTHNFKLGTDLFINKQQTLGILINGNISDAETFTHSRTPILSQSQNQVTRILNANGTSHRSRFNISSNINYRYADTAGRELSIDADYGYYDFDGRAYVPNVYTNPGNTATLSEYIFGNNTPVMIQFLSLKADYERPFKSGKLAAGFRSSYAHTYNTFNFFNYINKVPELDNVRSNQFEYTELINAIYTQYRRKIKKWNYQLGLRLEQTSSEGELVSANAIADKNVKRNYLNLFPSGGVTYQMNKKNTVALSFGKRIDRPTYQDLNPFENKIDELTYQKGNPFLLPQYTHNIELRHTYNYKLSTSISYSNVHNFFAAITDTIEGRRNFITQRNLARQKVFSFGASYPFSIARWWNVYANAGVNHSRYRATFEQGKTINLNATVANFYQQQTFTINKKWTAELSGFYMSPYVWAATYECRSMWSLDAGLQVKVLKEQGTIKASVSDIFKQMPWTGISRFGGLYVDAAGGWESRQFKVNFTYRFGNKQVKSARQRNTGLEDLNKRVQ